MGEMQPNKGRTGEREIAKIIRDLTGLDVKRRTWTRAGDSDLVGIPGWSIEVKRHKKANRADIRNWWNQTLSQCQTGERPVLFYRSNKDEWRAVFTLNKGPHLVFGYKLPYYRTVESSVQQWCSWLRLVGYNRENAATQENYSRGEGSAFMSSTLMSSSFLPSSYGSTCS